MHDADQKDRGRLIVMDAIDGAGKSTAMQSAIAWLKGRGLRVFDLTAYQKQHHRLPEATDPEIAETDALISAEPTHAWVGAAIRDEIIRANEGRTYSGVVAAKAFALDRLVLFTRVILPFLRAKADRWVIQDRGLISSIAYQPLQDERVGLEWLLSLEGNQLELSRPPDLLLLLRLSPEVAMQRLHGRGDKIDGHIYENFTFQEKLAARYRTPEVLAPYKNAGTRIAEIDASKSAAEVGAAVTKQLDLLCHLERSSTE